MMYGVLFVLVNNYASCICRSMLKTICFLFAMFSIIADNIFAVILLSKMVQCINVYYGP